MAEKKKKTPPDKIKKAALRKARSAGTKYLKRYNELRAQGYVLVKDPDHPASMLLVPPVRGSKDKRVLAQKAKAARAGK